MASNLNWYRTGTLSVASGTRSVSGVGTSWLTQARPGDTLYIGNAPAAEIESIESATALTLAADWPSATVTAGTYAIARTSQAWTSPGDLAIDIATYIDSITSIASTTTATIGTGVKTFVIPVLRTVLLGATVSIAATSSPSNSMAGVVIAVARDTLTVNVLSVLGFGTFSGWNIAVSGPPGARGSQGPRDNLLINGDFAINQRVKSGSLSAGVYGFDRWKAGSSGCTISFNGSVTLRGSITQVVEPGVFGIEILASQQITVSVSDPSANLTVTVGSSTGTITAGGGRRSVTLTTSASDNGNIDFTITAASATTFRQIKMEQGSEASGWSQRDSVTELRLCQRYYQKSYLLETAPGTAIVLGAVAVFAGSVYSSPVRFAQQMRATPTFVLYSPLTANVVDKVMVDFARDIAVTTFGINALGVALFYGVAESLSPASVYSLHYTAEAEL